MGNQLCICEQIVKNKQDIVESGKLYKTEATYLQMIIYNTIAFFF